LPFPEVADGEIRAPQVARDPEGTLYVVPSGMHERLRQAALTEPGRVRDPKVDLAQAGWVLLQTDGMTDRVNVDAPDGFEGAALIRRFARAHDAGSLAVAYHPSGRVDRSSTPHAFGASRRG
jgi:hypothetical protein